MPGGMLAIIPCTGQKDPELEKAPAEDIWMGTHFQLILYHARTFYDQVLVLSYKYGLIPPEQEIESYDVDMRVKRPKEKIAWWFKVKHQIDDLADNDPPDLVALYTGSFERDKIVREFVKHGVKQVIVPFEGLGIGLRQQAVYDEEPPFDPEKVKRGEYEVRTNQAGTPISRYLPPPTEVEGEIEWED